MWNAFLKMAHSFRQAKTSLLPAQRRNLDFIWLNKYSVDSTHRQILSRPKDSVLIHEQLRVVYKIPCSTYQASYIGQTGRRLKQRLEEHKRSVRQADFNMSHLLNMHGQTVIQFIGLM